MNLALTVIFFGILVVMSIEDFSTKLVNPILCALVYLVALVRALYLGQPLASIVFSSIWLALLLGITEFMYQLINSKVNKTESVESIGVGFGDIMIAPAITLFATGYSLQSLLIAFLSALIYGRIAKDSFIPLIPFFTLGLFVGTILF